MGWAIAAVARDKAKAVSVVRMVNSRKRCVDDGSATEHALDLDQVCCDACRHDGAVAGRG
jgi:hypothetical protein